MPLVATLEFISFLATIVALIVLLRGWNRTLPRDLVVFGEVGLAGEIRPVPNGQERLSEAKKHGYQRALVPAANAPRKGIAGMEIIAVETVAAALNAY